MKAKKGRNSWFITLWYLKCKQYIELTVNDELEKMWGHDHSLH